MAESEVAMVNEEPMSEEQSGHSSGSDGSDEEDSQHSVVPYSYEPEQESGSEAESGASSDGENRLEGRLLNSKW